MYHTKMRLTVIGLLLALVSSGTTIVAQHRRHARQLVLPAPTLERTGVVPVVFPLGRGFTGHITLHVRWTDSLGRVVDDKTISTELFDGFQVSFPIDLSRAIAMENKLHVDAMLDGKNIKGESVERQESAETTFISRPPYSGWHDYNIIMWQPYAASLIPELKKLGINGGMFATRSPGLPQSLIDTDMRWYVENIATDYYSAYHRYFGDRSVEWAMEEARNLYKKDPTSLEAFKRHPSFWDPYWRTEIHDRAVTTAERFAPYRPFFYSLADESGIASLDDQWDFDFSDQSLVPMRRWLREQYGSLGALNQEWGTDFTDWNLVMPLTTSQAVQKPGDNFSQWADFKNWMDFSYADALKMGADAIHSVDPKAYVEIGGAQMPEWGGYDYSRLTKAVDAIEPYDIGRNVDIIHSLKPSMPILTTSFAVGPKEQHRVWYELLHGNRGLILWDAKKQYVSPDGKPGTRGEEAGKYYNEIRDGIGALIINSRPMNDGIVIHYSQPSIRTQWMLEERPHGQAWMTRGPKYEFTTGNKFMRLRVSWCDLIEDLGMQPKFISYDQLEDGQLLRGGYRVLVLPQSSALSPAESEAIREFVAQGGIAIADGMPGTYDAHSKRLPQSSLADLFGGQNAEQVNVHDFRKGKAILLNVDILGYLDRRLEDKEGPTHQLMEKLLRSIGVRPVFAVEDAAGHSVPGVDAHVYVNGGVRVIALESNPEIRASELGPPDFVPSGRFEKPVTVQLHLPHPMYVYDTRAHKDLGQNSKMTLTIDPYEPMILTASDTPLAQMQVSVPRTVKRGSVANIAVRALPAQADVNVFHVDVLNPQGNRVLYYSGNVIVKGGSGIKAIPFAANDTPGAWTVIARDVFSGKSVTEIMNVE